MLLRRGCRHSLQGCLRDAARFARRHFSSGGEISNTAASPPSFGAAGPCESSGMTDGPTSSGATESLSPSPLRANSKAAPNKELSGFSRLSVGRNASVASSWETVPNWCELCFEPLNGWDYHVGKREHICMEMVLNAAAAHPRNWSAKEVWQQTELFRTHYARRPRGQPRTPSAQVRRMLRAGLVLPAVDSPMNIFYEAYDKASPAARREELLLLLLHLQEKGFLSFSPELYNAACHQGSLVLYKEVMPSLASIFPTSEVRGCSAMTAMIASNFNAESVYVLCGMEALVTPELMHSRLASPDAKGGRSNTSNSEAAGRAEDGGDEDPGSGEDVAELEDGITSGGGVPRAVRTSLPRAILGSLRWALELDVVAPPPALHMCEVRYAHYTTLAARAARLLVAELIYDRVSEYVYRVEDVLRSDRGQELIRALRGAPLSSTVPSSFSNRAGEAGALSAAQMRALFARTLVPPLSNHGMLQFTNGAGLCATSVLGTASSNRVIQGHEARRAMRMKSRKTGKSATTPARPLSRQVRHA